MQRGPGRKPWRSFHGLFYFPTSRTMIVAIAFARGAGHNESPLAARSPIDEDPSGRFGPPGAGRSVGRLSSANGRAPAGMRHLPGKGPGPSQAEEEPRGREDRPGPALEPKAGLLRGSPQRRADLRVPPPRL